MSLADSWVEDDSVSAISGPFHDEVEEDDEVKEEQDGCGGVQWWLYVLKQPGTSNKMLHELARDVRGVEKRRGKRLTVAQYKTIFQEWEAASKPFLRPANDYFTEFLAKLDSVKVPKGETLNAAFERAKLREPPIRILSYPNPGVRLLASLCAELQEMAGDEAFMLCQMSVAKLFGHSCHRTVSNWIKVLKTLGIVTARPWVNRSKSKRYFYSE